MRTYRRQRNFTFPPSIAGDAVTRFRVESSLLQSVSSFSSPTTRSLVKEFSRFHYPVPGDVRCMTFSCHIMAVRMACHDTAMDFHGVFTTRFHGVVMAPSWVAVVMQWESGCLMGVYNNSMGVHHISWAFTFFKGLSWQCHGLS